MITLFKKNETNFETNGIGSLDKNILNPEISWKDNGVFTLEFRYPLFGKHGFEIENSSIIRANDPEGSNLFFVYKITPSMGYVTVLCYQISYKLAFNSINDTNIVNKSGQNALSQMSAATQYPHSFMFSSDIQTTATSRVVRKNPIEFLLDTGLDNSFVNRWGGHIVRHSFNIAMNSAYGSNKGYTIRHKKDLKGYEAEFDESTVITRIRPIGYDGLMLPEIYVDSLLINNYTEPRIQEIEYSDVKVKQKPDDEEGFSTTELAYAELRRLANLEFSKNKVDVPSFSCKVEFVNLKDTAEYKDLKSLKQILAGDIVKVVHSEDNFNIEAQMVEYKWNPLNQSYVSITLGNYTKSFTSTVSKASSMQTNLSKIAQQAQSAMTTANGKNTVYRLTYKPSITNSSVEGDLLYLKNGDKTELWILEKVNGKLQWVLQVSDATQEELKSQMAQAKTDINSAVDSANAAVDSANSAVDKANASVTAVQANTQLINDVNSIANNAKTQAQTANTNAQTAMNNAQTALTSANTANTNAQTALDNAGKLSEDVSALDTIANQAKSDADTALINANKGITDAKTALNKAIGVDTRVTTEITNVNNTLATKANSTTVDAIKGTVSSQGTAISQNATDIKLKADSTVVDAIKGTVDNQGTLISQNSKDIALKANKSSVDTLTGRVSANETAIDVTAQGVSTLVTKTDGTNTALSQFKQDYEGFKGTVYTKGQTDTKVSTVQQSVDNFKTTVSNTYSSKAETDSKVTAVQANVDKIGNYTAYANNADGTNGFTTVYPNLNLGDNTKTFVGADGEASNLRGSIRIDPATQKTQDGDINYLTFKPTRDGYDWFRFFLIPDTATPNMKKVAVKPNTKYTFSVLLKGTGQHTIYAYQNWTVQNTPWSLQINLTNDWKLYTFTVTSSNVIPDRNVQFFIRSDNGTEVNLKKPKVEQGSIATTYMTSEKELTSNDIPKYIGYSVRQSENPKDFSWQPYSGLNSYKVIEATTSIEQNSKEIALKANKSEVDTLSGKVSTAEGAITTMAGQIKLKANQTDVDTVKGRVTSAEGSISLISGQVALKANQADVNTITGKVSSLESSFTIQSGQISALNTKTDGQTTQIGSLQSSYSGLVSTVANTVDGLANTNLLSNSEFLTKDGWNAFGVYDTFVIGTNQWDNYNGSNTLRIARNSNSSSDWWGVDSDKIRVYPGQKLSIGAAVFLTGVAGIESGRATVSINYYKDSSSSQFSAVGLEVDVSKIRQKNYYLLENKIVPDEAQYALINIGFNGTGNYLIGQPKFVIGEKIGIYTPAKPASQSQITQMVQDLDGFKTTVASTYADKVSVASQITQSATAVTSDVQSWTNNKLTAYSTTQQTATSITNAVASKADKTQITQLSNQITSVVTDVSAIQVGGQNLLLGTATAKTSTITQTDNFTTTDPYNFSVSKLSAFNFEVDDYITLSFDWETTSTTGDTRPEINSTPYGFGTVISAKGTNGATSITKTITASEQRGHIEIIFKVSSTVKVSEASKLRLRFDNHQLNSTFTIKNAKFEKGNKATDWCIAPQEVANQSQINQLSTDINLRVSKGDVTSQINLESGRVLIDSKQLLLNANNVKFSGSAFIPNSVIQNLSADKITAGTLNAANVNVINLNARSLTAGTISGNNLSLNLDTGAVQFTKGYIAGNNNKIRFDLDNSYLHSINTNGSGFQITNGQFSFFDGLLSSTPQYLGAIMLDFFSTDKSGIKVYGNKGASIQGGNSTISVGYSLLGDNKIGLSGDTGVTGGLSVLGKLSVLGSKNAIHVTRDGIRATPAYETAESYLGDIGRSYTRENYEVWVEIDELFSDTVNTDIAYEVFLQAYSDASFWVEDFRSDKFLVKSDKPMARFAWELKAKRRGYENERLVLQEGFDNKMLLDAHAEGIFKGDSENESTN